LVDSDGERAQALKDQLAASGITDVLQLPGSANLAAQVALMSPDIIIVDMALPDRDALEDIRHVTAVSPKPIILFADQDDPSFMEEAIAAGVSSYNVTGLSLPHVKTVVAAAIALFQRYRRVERELEAAKAGLEERRLIERAKTILMRDRNMTEPEAYRWLRKRAMNEARKIVSVAAEVIKKDAADARRA
jgi:response regulator NasT